MQALLELVQAMLEPVSRMCFERLSVTRCASDINSNDLRGVREAFRTVLQVKDAEHVDFVKLEEFW